PVRYTEAREVPVQRSLQLPGSVESKTMSMVAAEVAGLVVELPAREGQTVLRDQPLAKLRTTNLELRLQSAAAQLKEAAARRDLAAANLERSRELFDAQIVAQQTLDDTQSDFNAWQGRVDSLGAEIERLRYELDRSVIRAPFAGIVVAERTEVGQWLGVGGEVVELMSLEELEVRVEVPERYFRNMKPRGKATVTFEALPGVEVQGTVSAIIPRADTQARTFPLKVRIPNRGGRIAPGMLAHVTLSAGESYRATVVPKDAVVRQGSEQIVFTINGDGTVERAAVTTGSGVGEWVVVEGPVKPGQKVVTRGNERLMPGQPVRAEALDYRLP
ncbi:MAG: efflux RND transporter periplasmic adaptor subunit, partial [Candidatus Polarisedimenticolia bacterium]